MSNGNSRFGYGGFVFCCGALSLVMIGLSIFCFMKAGYDFGKSTEQKRSIEAGVGKWTVNPETGATQFDYGVKEK